MPIRPELTIPIFISFGQVFEKQSDDGSVRSWVVTGFEDNHGTFVASHVGSNQYGETLMPSTMYYEDLRALGRTTSEFWNPSRVTKAICRQFANASGPAAVENFKDLVDKEARKSFMLLRP